jgi:hypothetical protein
MAHIPASWRPAKSTVSLETRDFRDINPGSEVNCNLNRWGFYFSGLSSPVLKRKRITAGCLDADLKGYMSCHCANKCASICGMPSEVKERCRRSHQIETLESWRVRERYIMKFHAFTHAMSVPPGFAHIRTQPADYLKQEYYDD